MPKKKRQFTWSYSALGSWATCPLQYRFAYLEDHPRPPNRYRDEGIRIHDALEKFFLNARARKLPPELVKLEAYLRDKKAEGYLPEVKVCFDRDWQEVARGSKQHWGTVKLDLHKVIEVRGTPFLHVIDLKTGKVKDFSDQGRIYLSGMLPRYSDVRRGSAEFAYSKTGDVVGGDGRKKILPVDKLAMLGYQKELNARVARMEADVTFPAKPGAACRWCDFSKHKGGPCTRG